MTLLPTSSSLSAETMTLGAGECCSAGLGPAEPAALDELAAPGGVIDMPSSSGGG